MPIEQIRDRLINWRSEEIYRGSKSFREQNSRSLPGEYYFSLKAGVQGKSWCA